MEEYVSFAHGILRTIVFTGTLINELVLLSSQWIISPSAQPSSPPAIQWPHPAVTSVVYAFLEPIFFNLFIQPGMAQWIILPTTLLHIIACDSTLLWLHQWRDPSHPNQKGDKPTAGPSRIMDVGLSVKIYFAVQSAAACDAALLQFATNLDDWILRSRLSWITILFGYFAVLGYILARIADVRICQYLYKTPIYKRQPLDSLAVQLSCLVLALSTKISFGIFIGLYAFPMLRVLSGQEVRRPLGRGASNWPFNMIAETPEWLLVALIVLCTPLYYILGVRLYSQRPEE